MSAQTLNETVQERIDAAEHADQALTAAFARFYAATARLEAMDGGLFKELDAAWVTCYEEIRRVAWLDGFACGRDPMLLVLAGGEGDE